MPGSGAWFAFVAIQLFSTTSSKTTMIVSSKKSHAGKAQLRRQTYERSHRSPFTNEDDLGVPNQHHDCDYSFSARAAGAGVVAQSEFQPSLVHSCLGFSATANRRDRLVLHRCPICCEPLQQGRVGDSDVATDSAGGIFDMLARCPHVSLHGNRFNTISIDIALRSECSS